MVFPHLTKPRIKNTFCRIFRVSNVLFFHPILYSFQNQDFDGDGSLSKMDLYRYFERITNKLLTPDEINKIIDEVFKEVHLTKDNDKISFTQFQTIVVPLDFQARLQLPI